MNPLTYEQYRTDPAFRSAIEAEVRQLRREAFGQYLWQPLAAAMRVLITRRLRAAIPRIATAMR